MAETKPTKVGQWATNGGTTVEPALGEKQTGWTVATKAPARFMNWLLNVAYGWHSWLNERMFDGAATKDLVVQGVDVTGTDQDGGDLDLKGGQATGDGSSCSALLAAVFGAAGAAVRAPVVFLKADGSIDRIVVPKDFDGLVSKPTGANVIAGEFEGKGTEEGVRATGGATGDGMKALGTAGHGAWVESDTTTPEKAALHVVPQDTDANTKVMGDYQTHTVSGLPSVYKGGSEYARLVGKVYSMTAVENLGATGPYTASYTVPANTLRAGSVIRVRAGLIVTADAGGGNVVVDLEINGAREHGTKLRAINTGDIFHIDLIGTIHSIGAADPVTWSGSAMAGADAALAEVICHSASYNDDTTDPLILTVELSVGGGGNVVQLQTFVVDISD